MNKRRHRLLIGFVIVMIAFSLPLKGSSSMQVRAEVNKGLAHILSVVEIKPNPNLAMEPVPGWTVAQVPTRDRKYSAYLLCVPVKKEDPERCAHRVYFDDYAAPAKSYEIRGEPELEEVTRTIAEVKWLNNLALSYERWPNPHFGHRYVIDVRTRKQVAAYDLFG